MFLGEFPTFQRHYSPTKYWERPAQQQSDSFQKMNLQQHCCQNLKPYTFFALHASTSIRKQAEIKNGSVCNLTTDQDHITFFWDMMPCSVVDIQEHFAGTCCIHLRGINGIT
jgi:hypothetical protein